MPRTTGLTNDMGSMALTISRDTESPQAPVKSLLDQCRDRYLARRKKRDNLANLRRCFANKDRTGSDLAAYEALMGEVDNESRALEEYAEAKASGSTDYAPEYLKEAKREAREQLNINLMALDKIYHGLRKLNPGCCGNCGMFGGHTSYDAAYLCFNMIYDPNLSTTFDFERYDDGECSYKLVSNHDLLENPTRRHEIDRLNVQRAIDLGITINPELQPPGLFDDEKVPYESDDDDVIFID